MDRSGLEAVITRDHRVIAGAAFIVALGLIGEYWKDIKKVWGIYWFAYPLTTSLVRPILRETRVLLFFPLLVVGGVLLEWLFDSDVSQREAEYTQVIDEQNTRLANAAQVATERAADAEQKTLALLKENIELEHALAPRDFNVFGLAVAIGKLARVPVFLGTNNSEEPQHVASEIESAFGFKFSDTPSWTVSWLVPQSWVMDGITIKYPSAMLGNENEKEAADLSTAICEYLKSEHILTRVHLIMGNTELSSIGASLISIVIQVGNRPDLFWSNKRIRESGAKFPESPNVSLCTPEEWRAWEREQKKAAPQ